MTARVPPELSRLRPLIEPLLARLSDLLPGCRLVLAARQVGPDRWEIMPMDDLFQAGAVPVPPASANVALPADAAPR